MILLVTACFAIVAVVIAKMIPSYYIGEARVLVGVPSLRVTSAESILSDISPDADRIQNEGFVIQSREFAWATIERLKLMENPEFNPMLREEGWSFRRFLRSLPASWQPKGGWQAYLPGGNEGPPSAEVLQNYMVENLLAHVEVSPLGRSHVLSVRAQSQNPETAATIANTMAALYLERQKSEKVEASEEAEKFLTARIAELREQVEKADQAVEEYRRKYSLYKGPTAGVTTQQMTELNTQLILSQTAKAEADSRLQEAQALRGVSSDGQSVPEVLRSPLIQSLKQNQAEAERRMAELSQSYGNQHPRMVAARAEAAEIKRKVDSEVARVIEGLRRESRSANARFEGLRRDFDRSKAQMGGVNERQIRLDALEREATVNRNLLEQMLSRAKETIGQDKLQRPNAKLISKAAAPSAPSFPPKSLMVFLGVVAGGILAVVLALLRESMDHTFRRGDQVEMATGLPVLALVPQIKGRTGPTLHILRKPVSPFAEALRKLYIGLELSESARSPKVVMFSSAIPQEGKSVMVGALGRMLASHGRRVLLIDCDWRCPSLHRLFRFPNRGGLAALLGENQPDPGDIIMTDALSGVDVLVAGDFTPQATRLLTSERMGPILRGFAEHYDMILIDTPPVLVGAEVLSIARVVDKVAYITRWGSTPREVTLDGLKQLLEAQADVAGVVLSRVDPKKYQQYTSSRMDYQYERPVLARLG